MTISYDTFKKQIIGFYQKLIDRMLTILYENVFMVIETNYTIKDKLKVIMGSDFPMRINYLIVFSNKKLRII